MSESEADEVWEIDTPSGAARVHLFAVRRARPRSSLVLGHGFGGGVQSPDLRSIAAELPDHGIEVVLVEQPWRVAGHRMGGSAVTLDRAWVSCVADIRSRGIGTRRLVLGGRSTGARVACRTAAECAPDALFLLAFPLHPARRAAVVGPPPTRMPELAGAARLVPTVVVQGARDKMGQPGEIAAQLAEHSVPARVVPIMDADHSFSVPARSHTSTAAALGLVSRAARATALRLTAGRH